MTSRMPEKSSLKNSIPLPPFSFIYIGLNTSFPALAIVLDCSDTGFSRLLPPF